jgi:6,7-dimethyl-8-ribityllumazine synthase
MTTYEGQLVAPAQRKIAIVVARFNELVTERLLEGAVAALRRCGGDESQVEVARVPGAFELAPVARKLAGSGRFAAVLCLGCVIRGATDHYDYVCAQAAAGIARAGDDSGVPVLFGLLTTDTLEQAMDRAGAKAGNKGSDAMLAALEMADLMEKLVRGGC